MRDDIDWVHGFDDIQLIRYFAIVLWTRKPPPTYVVPRAHRSERHGTFTGLVKMEVLRET